MNYSHSLYRLILFAAAFALVGCAPNVNKTFENSSVSPTEEFSGKNSFGDGYIAHVPIADLKEASQEKIVEILVTQWLEHYKNESTAADATIKHYTVGEIMLVDTETHREDPSMPIIAMVQFSILPPDQTPNEWRCYSTSVDNPWCQLDIRFGVYGNEGISQYYWLRIESNAG